MRKTTQIVISFTLIFFNTIVFSQVKGYDESAFLFSQETINGTARYNAMSGAFGALGGDLSVVNINPAGLAVFTTSTAAISLNVNAVSNSNNFYNTESFNDDRRLDFAQAGGLVVFNTNQDKFSKFTLSINTSVIKNFDSSISFKGNNHISNESFFLEPDADSDPYNNVTFQKYRSNTNGENTSTTFSIATKYDKNTYLGFSIVSSSIDFNQDVQVKESSKDINNNTFNGNLSQTISTYAEGIGFSFGVITKPIKNLRIGLALQTPTWYTLTEDSQETITTFLSNASTTQPTNEPYTFEYKLRTPSKVTGSIAYVFEKKGLLSLDYTYKDYSKAKLSPTKNFEGNFHDNERIDTNYNAVTTINIGGEYRFKYLSLRGGYHFENSPYKITDAIDSDYYNGYSLGFGFKTNQYSTLDFAFNQINELEKNFFLTTENAIITKTQTNRFTATYSIRF